MWEFIDGRSLGEELKVWIWREVVGQDTRRCCIASVFKRLHFCGLSASLQSVEQTELPKISVRSCLL